jgi:hypothetical protein
MNPIQRASRIRKAYYIGAILALFFVSMLWRGVIPVPLAGSARAAESRSFVARVADTLNGASILNQSRSLDLRELEQGESEVEGSFVRLAMTGSRGFVVTYFWLSAIDKQKRNDFHEMEQNIQIVTRLQPHFLTPWLFQSWNISYNVSVEMQASGDMYHYIARGIDLLAEGERRNTHVYKDRKVGSPEMRYWIGFYYGNKFGVSDQVEVLRCLFQLSSIPFNERDPKNLTNPLKADEVDLPKFKEFCKKNPHLVRRLRGEDRDAAGSGDEATRKKVQEALKCPRPEDIVQFLRDNADLPSRFVRDSAQLNDPDRQFPVLPPKFNEGPDEYNPTMETKDDFSGFKAARAWYIYALGPVPPNTRDMEGNPLPSTAPHPAPADHEGQNRPGEYDPFRYRVPRSPMLIIFRQGGPRSQTSQAEMEQKEGWFDDDGWRVDDPRDPSPKWWFPDTDAPRGVLRPLDLEIGKNGESSLQEWQRAAQMWRKHGEENGLIVSPERLNRYQQASGGYAGGVPNTEITDAEMNDPALRARFEGRIAMFFYPQNRHVTNFPFFLATTQVEAKPETVEARKVLWQAEQARKLSRNKQAIDLYKDGLKKWKAVLAKYPEFHRMERSERIEEETFTYELNYIRLLMLDDADVRREANERFTRLTADLKLAAAVLGGLQPFPLAADWQRDPRQANLMEDVKWAVAESKSPFYKLIGEGEDDNVTDRERLGTPWIKPETKGLVRQNMGLDREKSAPPPAAASPTRPTPKTLENK